MKRIFGRFSVIFALVCGQFLLSGCYGEKLVWSNGNGIVTYNRHTGQFEMLWEYDQKQYKTIHDTIYVCPEDSSVWVKKK